MATTKKAYIQFSDGGSPETWNRNCSINTNQEFTIEGTAGELAAPNCADQDAATWMARWIETLSAGISGAGTMDPLSYAALRTKMLAAQSFPIRVMIDLTGSAGGGYYTGNYVMTSLALTKEGKGYLTATMAFSSDGEIVWVSAA